MSTEREERLAGLLERARTMLSAVDETDEYIESLDSYYPGSWRLMQAIDEEMVGRPVAMWTGYRNNKTRQHWMGAHHARTGITVNIYSTPTKRWVVNVLGTDGVTTVPGEFDTVEEAKVCGEKALTGVRDE